MMWEVNWLAVLVGAVANMVLGWLWYSPTLFGKQWADLMGWPLEDKAAWEARQRGMAKVYAITFGMALLVSYTVNGLLSALDVFTAGEAIQIAVFLWIGLVGATSLSSILFERRPVKLWAIDAGYILASFILIGLISVFLP
ncbi:MAG: DUF1761 domain-containing protein [Candidatus Moraniibacteriota bacterium]